MVMPTPPWSWIACWPIKRPERPICTLAAVIALRRSAASASSASMVASMHMLRTSTSAINMSAAQCCSTWKLPIGTPNCLRVCCQPTRSSHLFAEWVFLGREAQAHGGFSVDFEQAGGAHAASDAHGDDGVLGAAAAAFDQDMAGHARSAHAEG